MTHSKLPTTSSSDGIDCSPRLPWRRAAIAMLLIAGSAPLFAHEGDPKIFDVLPPVVAPAFRAAEGGGGVAGAAAQFEAENVVLLSWLPLGEFATFEVPSPSSGNDCWGYVSASGREYALMGLANATGFVEITNPANAQIIDVKPGPQSLWRDIKVYQDHVYVVTEGGSGIQVFDVSQIDDGVVTLVNTINDVGTGATHNVAINEESGRLYRTGGSNNGLRIYSLATPSTPVYVGAWADRYVHDAQVVNWTAPPFAGREIAFCCAGFNGGGTQTGLSIVDVTDPAAPIVLSHLEYPSGAYSHQGWLSADRKYFYLNDEQDETSFGLPTTTRVIDVSDLTAPFQASTFSSGSPAIDHNLYVRDNLIYEANYRSGVRIFDATNPTAPVPYAFFDTFPGSDSANFNGLWSVYPFFPSGTVIGSDLERGLFVWYIGDPPLSFEFPDGLPTLIDPAGELLRVQVEASAGLTVAAGSVALNVFADGGVTTVPMDEVAPGLFEATTPKIACTTTLAYSFTASASNGIALSAPAPAVAAIAAVGETSLFVDDMETNTGWTVGAPGDDATSGIWVRVDPNGTTAQPEDDNPSGTGTLCWVTGQGSPGGQAGEADVDNGSTTLTSPILNAVAGEEGEGEPVLEYYRWYSNNLGNNPNADSMPISISNDGGQSWTLLEDVSENASAWVRKSWRISDFVTPTATMRVRFVARDLPGASLVEAGVDDVRIVRYACVDEVSIPGDLDGNGVVDGADLGVMLGQWGGPGSADLDGNGVVDGADLGVLLGNWTAS